MSAFFSATWAQNLSALVVPFVSLLVVANVVPILPVVLDIVGQSAPEQRRSVMLRALLLGYAVALVVALVGPAGLALLGVTLADLSVAGGVLLLVFAVHDLLFSREQRKEPMIDVADDPSSLLVPLGIPVIVGPATLATVALLTESHGVGPTLVAIGLNMLINGAILLLGRRAADMIGHGLMRAIGKVFGLALAALGVSMIRSGLAAWSIG